MPSNGETGPFDRIGDRAELGIGAGEHRHFAGADEVRIAPQEELHDLTASSVSSSATDRSHARPVGSVRHERAGLIGRGQYVDAGRHDLRRASMVDGQADDLDAGEAGLDVDEQTRVGAVEAVDRLRRIADEEQVVATRSQQIDERMLEWVEVLRLVDQQVPESPPDRLGEVVVASQIADRVGQDVVEVDHAAALLEGLEVRVDGGAPIDPGARVTLLAAGGRRVVLGVDAARRGPVDLGEVGGEAASVAGVDRVADQPAAIVDDGERAALGVGPSLLEHPEHHRVECAGLDVFADAEPVQSLAHLAGGLAGERERQRVAWVGGVGGDAVGDAPREHARLARSGAGDHRDQVRFGRDRGALVGVQIGDQRVRIHRATVRARTPDRPADRARR